MKIEDKMNSAINAFIEEKKNEGWDETDVNAIRIYIPLLFYSMLTNRLPFTYPKFPEILRGAANIIEIWNSIHDEEKDVH